MAEEEVVVDQDMNATVNELQTQMTAVQAALEGTGQASLFKPRPFSGLPSEDINECCVLGVGCLKC